MWSISLSQTLFGSISLDIAHKWVSAIARGLGTVVEQGFLCVILSLCGLKVVNASSNNTLQTIASQVTLN